MLGHARVLTGLVVLTLPTLAACDRSPGGEQTTSSAPAATADTQGTVTRTEVVSPEEPAPPPQQAVIQSQPGPNGSQVALNKAQVTGDVMTAQLTYTSSGSGSTEYLKLSEVSVIDDATAQRIGVLKDSEGKWLAAPIYGDDEVSINLHKSPAIVWFKFPAPPATSGTVSINIPEVAPFDGVPVTR